MGALKWQRNQWIGFKSNCPKNIRKSLNVSFGLKAILNQYRYGNKIYWKSYDLTTIRSEIIIENEIEEREREREKSSNTAKVQYDKCEMELLKRMS